jgi:hypothetical protein
LAALALTLALASAARAETGLVVDPAWPAAPFGHDFAFGDQGPRAMAADDQRIWVLGNRASVAGQGGVLTALQPGGAKDTGFSGDGELPIDIGPTDSGAYGWDVVVLPNGDAAVLSNRLGAGESDLAIAVVRPDGSPDPAFAGDGVAVVAGPGVETPMRLAYDPSTQRFLVTGESFATQGAIPDTFVAAITWAGAADAGFGTAGFRVFDGGGIDHVDFGDAIAPLGDGRIAVWYRWNAGGEISSPDPRTALRVLTSAGADDIGFAGDGDLPTPAMTYGRDLALVDGTLVGVGSRSVVGVSSESMIMRVRLDGGGLVQTPVDLVPGVEESLDRLAVAPGALLVSGLQLPRVGSEIRRSAIAARLSRSTLQPLERALTDVPNAKDGYQDIAAAPGVADGLLLTTYVSPNDTQVFRAVPGTLPPDSGSGPSGPGGGTSGADTTAPVVGSLRVTPVIRLDRRLPAVLASAPVGLRFRLSESATVSLTFRVRHGRRWRPVSGARIVLSGLRKGAHQVRFTGRLSRRRALAPGRYRVLVTAVDRAGNASPPVVGAFRLVRGRG